MNGTMNACVLHAVGDLRYEKVARPVRKPGELTVKIMASGICGSDIPRVFTKGTYHFPTIPGHEFGGVIIDADEVDQAYIGRKCAVFPLLPCFQCSSCQGGHYQLCKNYNYFGSRCDGGFAEYLNIPKFNAVLAPDSLTYEEIAMCEPCSVAIHALEKAQRSLTCGCTVAIFGSGPIGVMTAMWARKKGAGRIFLVDIDKAKLDFANSLGFADTILGNATDAIKKATGGEGADAVIEGAGVSATLEQAVQVTKAFGTVVTMGNPAGEMKLTQNGYWEIMRKELTVCGTWNSSYSPAENNWRISLQAMTAPDFNLRPLISHKFPLSECNTAFTLMRDRKEFFNKVMFVLG